MPAVLIYSQKNLEYIVLSNRRIFSKDKDLVRPISNADKHVLWTDLANRKHIQKEGEHFFKQHQDYLGTPPSMDDVDGKMSPGFFLYLTFLRFQGQVYQASIVRNSDINKLTKEKSEFNDNLAKLLTLQTAMEHLVKAREYVDSESAVPEGARAQRGSRGGVFYDPDELKDKDQQEEMPTGTREVDVVQAEPLDDDEDDDEELGERQGPETDERFLARMKDAAFVPVNTLDYPTITKAEMDRLVIEASNAGNGDYTVSSTLITPNIAIVNDEGVVTQVTTSDGQIIPTSEEAGKLLIYVNPRGDDLLGDNRIQVEWRTPPTRKDPSGGTSKQYSVAYRKSKAAIKHVRATLLGSKISQIEQATTKDMKSSDRRTKDAALAIAIIHDTFRRVGKGSSKVYWDGKEGRPGPKKGKDGKFIHEYVDTFGVTSMQAQHIIVRGDKVKLRFLGKRGQLNEADVTDPKVADELIKRKNAAKKPTDGIIDVNETVVNAYLKNITGEDLTAKDFRTYHGTRIAYDVIGKRAIPKLDRTKVQSVLRTAIGKGAITNEAEFREFTFMYAFKQHGALKRNVVGEPVSKRLGNKPKVAIDNYINPLIFSDNPYNKNWDEAFKKETASLLKMKYPKADVKVAQDWLTAVNKKNYDAKGLTNPRRPKNWKKGDAVPPGLPKKDKGKKEK